MGILQEFFLKYIQIFADINLIGSTPLRLHIIIHFLPTQVNILFSDFAFFEQFFPYRISMALTEEAQSGII